MTPAEIIRENWGRHGKETQEFVIENKSWMPKTRSIN